MPCVSELLPAGVVLLGPTGKLARRVRLSFDVEVLTVGGGVGELSSISAAQLSEAQVPVPPTPEPASPAVVNVPESDAERVMARALRDTAYAEDGWTVRTAAGWLDHLDTLLALLPDALPTPDTEGPAS